MKFTRDRQNHGYKAMKSNIKTTNDCNIKNVYIDKLDDIVDKYNNTYHKTTKMTPVDVNLGTYFDFGLEIN